MSSDQQRSRYYVAAIPLESHAHILADVSLRIREGIARLGCGLEHKVELTDATHMHLTLVEPIPQELDAQQQPWASKLDAIASRFPELKCDALRPWALSSKPTLCVSYDSSLRTLRTLRYQLEPSQRFTQLRRTLYEELYPTKEGIPALDDETGASRLSAGGHLTLIKFNNLTDEENNVLLEFFAVKSREASESESEAKQATELGINVNWKPDLPESGTLHGLVPSLFLPDIHFTTVKILESQGRSDRSEKASGAVLKTLLQAQSQ